MLSKWGIKKGDRVIIYMPMIPEAIYGMLACSRIGAIHSLVFGGFSAKELAVRINHAQVYCITVTLSFATIMVTLCVHESAGGRLSVSKLWH